MGCTLGCKAFVSTLVLVLYLGMVEAAWNPHQRQARAGEGSGPPRFSGHVKDTVASDALYHELGHSHSEHIPGEEGSTRWFIRRSDILGGRPLATVDYVLEAIKRFERRHANALGKAPKRAHRRGLLASALPPGANPNATALQGELDVDSLYWAVLKLGTPATQTATVQIDSGSDLLWIQCSECGRYCVPTRVAPYRSSASSTASYAACSQCPALNATLCPVGQCSIACTRSGLTSPAPSSVCQSVYGYGDNSQVLFNVQSDVFTFSQLGGTTISSSIVFGCDVAETPGLITNAKVNGLAGLGRSQLSLPSQLYAAGKIKQDSFSVCLGGFEGGGALLFGNDTTPPKAMAYTPMGNGSADTLYNATMTSVRVGNATLDVPAAGFYNASNDRPDAIFDTGSDLIALPGLLYNAIFAALNKSISLPPVSFATILNAGMSPTPSPPPRPTPTGTLPSFADSLGPPTCYQLDSALATGQEPYDASTNFPPLSFTFPGNASLVLHPDDYVQFLVLQDPLKSTRTNPSYLVYGCPFIFNTYGGYSLLGDYAMRNHYFTFDRTRQLIGFAALNCSTYQPRSSSAPIPF